MTIAFPQRMPVVGSVGVAFEIERVDYLSPEAGGTLGAITAGFPRWTLRVSLGAMLEQDADVWGAWLDVQRGAQRVFVGFDMDRQVPRAARGGRPYQPSPAGWSQAVGDDGLAVLTLTGLLPGQQVSVRDYVGFAWGDGRLALTRAVEPAIASAGGIASFAVEPPIAPVVPSGATATLRRAGCLMRLVSGETKLGERGLAGFVSAGSTIVAAQDLIA